MVSVYDLADFTVWGCSKDLVPPFTALPLALTPNQLPSGAPRPLLPAFGCRSARVLARFWRFWLRFDEFAVPDRKVQFEAVVSSDYFSRGHNIG